jgi:hypothetical protein
VGEFGFVREVEMMKKVFEVQMERIELEEGEGLVKRLMRQVVR